MKFGMKMGHWTLKTGKILRTNFHDNCCHGDKFRILRLHFALKGSDFVTKSILRQIVIGSQIIGFKYNFSYYGNRCHGHQNTFSHSPIMVTLALMWHTDGCRRMERGTLMSGKMIKFSYHDNRCDGDQNTSSESNNGQFWH